MVFTVEEHGIIGGLGAAISEVLSESKKPVRVIRMGTKDQFIQTIGTRPFLRKNLQLDSQGIINRIKSSIEKYVV